MVDFIFEPDLSSPRKASGDNRFNELIKTAGIFHIKLPSSTALAPALHFRYLWNISWFHRVYNDDCPGASLHITRRWCHSAIVVEGVHLVRIDAGVCSNWHRYFFAVGGSWEAVHWTCIWSMLYFREFLHWVVWLITMSWHYGLLACIFWRIAIVARFCFGLILRFIIFFLDLAIKIH